MSAGWGREGCLGVSALVPACVSAASMPPAGATWMRTHSPRQRLPQLL